jgi:predicted murein hydrolase (TIGR00659 family)
MSDVDFSLWVYLSRTPLLWLTVTLTIYAIADMISRRLGRHPLANPVLMSILAVSAILKLSSTPYRTFFEGAQFIHFLLGPATVALAFPLYEHRHAVKKALLPMLVALIAGSFTALLSAVWIASLLGVPHEMLLSLAPKSVTAGVAMGITEKLGGDPTLTAVLVILTGMLGAMMATPLFNALGIKDYRARGFALGIASHGIGTARAFQVNPVAGTFAGIAMGLNAMLTSLILPLLVTYFPK